MPDALAKKYAEALYLSTAHNRVLQEKAGYELESLVELSKEYPDLASYFDSRLVDHDSEALFLARLAEGLGFSDDTHGLLRAVVKRNRFYHLRDIFLAFKEMLDKGNPRDEAVVVTAYPLKEDEKFRIRVQLQSILQKHVELSERIDRSLLGGIRVEIGHKIYDATLSYRLALLKDKLMREAT